ncbi:MAG: beta-propeller domain-containing protein [Deltaproteobacteria bacterium]|nr:beta-propeller domain-containing protein [Deltaproteobacteria bacterium]
MRRRSLLLPLLVPLIHCQPPSSNIMPDPDPVIAAPGTTTSASTFALTPLKTCTEVNTSIRARLETKAAATIQKQLNDELARRKAARDGGWTTCYKGGYYEEDVAYGATGAVGNSAPPQASPTSPATAGASADAQKAGDSATSYSTTNNQVASVDEADYMKNDGKYLYILAEGHLQIFSIFPTATAERVSKTKIDGTLKTLLLHKDTLIVYSAPDPKKNDPYAGWYYHRGECTYGYECDFSGDGQPTLASIYDVSDRAAPKLKTELQITSSYLSARGIGANAHTAVQYSQAALPLETYIPWDTVNDTCDDDSALISAAAALVAKNKATIDALPDAGLIPGVIRRDYDAQGKATVTATSVPCEGFFASNEPESSDILSVVSFNVDALQTPTITSVIGRPGPIYASPTALFVASRHQPDWSYYSYADGQQMAPEESSTVHKFTLGEGQALYVASGKIRGRVLNQFAMDEYDTHLRLASTVGHLPGPTENIMTVLAQKDATLEITGELGDIANGEDIRSVRFDGKRGFAVTFKKTDPLYYFDLSDHAAPAIMGALKIPGFSTYMHMLDDNHLLTIGYDAFDHGSFAFFDGVLLQIFDIENPYQPTLAHKERIGTRGSSSEALTNHLAFNYFAPRGQLAIPMTICEGGGDGSYGMNMTFSGTMLYDVNAQSGFNLAGKLQLMSAPDPQNGATCGNWWTNASSYVRRTVFMDETLWSVAGDKLVASPVSSIGTALKTLSLMP